MEQSKDISEIYSAMIEQPLVPPVLRIGVAGARHIPKDALNEITQKLGDIYGAIEHAKSEIESSPIINRLYCQNEVKVRFVSSLAEGIDRLAISKPIIPFTHEVAAVLPFAIDTYRKDFRPSGAVNNGESHSVSDPVNGTENEFDTLIAQIQESDSQSSSCGIVELDGIYNTPEARNEAYQYCSEIQINHCDFLIAVHDIDEASTSQKNKHAKTSGTEATLQAARRQRVPVISIDINNPSTVFFTHYADGGHNESTEKLNNTDELRNAINNTLRSILLFSNFFQTLEKPMASTLFARLDRYKGGNNLLFDSSKEADFDFEGPIQEKASSSGIFSNPFKRFVSTFTNSKKLAEEKEKLSLKSEETGDSEFDNIPKSVPSHRFYSAFLRADRLANFYAQKHRGTFLLIYLSAGLALIVAALAILLHKEKEIGLILGSLELIILAGIYLLYRRDHRHGYHERWLEYRCLAEFLRPMVYLTRLGKNYRIGSLRHPADYLGRKYVGHRSAARSWLYLYVQTIIRWAGVSNCNLNSDKRDTTVNFINNYWLKKQVDYHVGNAAKMSVVSKRLEAISKHLFYATFFVVLCKIILTTLKLVGLAKFSGASLASEVLVLGTAVLPIIATTIFAIRNHAEFDISSQRSLTMRASLITHVKSIQAALVRNKHTAEIIEDFQHAADQTIKDAAEWLEVYEIKEAELG